MKAITNYMKMTIGGYSRNEGLARMCVSAFASQLDPTIEEINDIKAAVSEAVTNCIVHGYKDTIGDIHIECDSTVCGKVNLRLEGGAKLCGVGVVYNIIPCVGVAFFLFQGDRNRGQTGDHIGSQLPVGVKLNGYGVCP